MRIPNGKNKLGLIVIPYNTPFMLLEEEVNLTTGDTTAKVAQINELCRKYQNPTGLVVCYGEWKIKNKLPTLVLLTSAGEPMEPNTLDVHAFKKFVFLSGSTVLPVDPSQVEGVIV